ncbi:MAG TPA: hypothetical protein VNO32_55395, partial [Candidatus Acidoferrum sp.]|nr:hypothetical protein [Candidatus Acidoferrum sp.]
LVSEYRELIRIVPHAQARDLVRIAAPPRATVSAQLLELVLVSGWRHRHRGARRLVARVRDVVRHAGRQEQVMPGVARTRRRATRVICWP